LTTQTKSLFFDPTVKRIYPALPTKPSDGEIITMLADNNENCPLSKVIVSEENRGNMRILKRFAFNAFADPFHSCKGMNFAMYASPGQGKTYVIKQWAKTIGIPLLFVQSDALDSTWTLFDLLVDLFISAGTPLEPQDNDYQFVLPPCIVFFDEAHALKNELRTGGLLNAMEANDGLLRTKQSGKNQQQYEIDCREVCWIAASTDPGLIFKSSQAFYERFRINIKWKSAGREEIAKIVKLDNMRKVSEEPHKFVAMSDEACAIVAQYETVPRKAIAFADQMILERRMMHVDWAEAAAVVAEDNGIDKFGLPYQIISLLESLAKRPVSDRNILNIVNCRREEFDSQYAPLLMAETKERGPLAATTSKGWAITRTGCSELDKRGIKHRGHLQLAERFI
jgi:Holliday junction resolvasome RuvABC ATP-dependent DNA helicase subunit